MTKTKVEHKPFRGILTGVKYCRGAFGSEYATGRVLYYTNGRGYEGEPFEGSLIYTSFIVKKGSFKGLKYIETRNSLYLIEEVSP